MSTFDKREESFEGKFAHDEELLFKVLARANKLLGLWAAEKLGKTGGAADDYAMSLVAKDVASISSPASSAQIHKDFVAAGVAPVRTSDRSSFRGIPRPSDPGCDER